MTLTDFLKPTYESLVANRSFQLLVKNRSAALEKVRYIRAEMAARVRDPKRIRDLFDR